MTDSGPRHTFFIAHFPDADPFFYFIQSEVEPKYIFQFSFCFLQVCYFCLVLSYMHGFCCNLYLCPSVRNIFFSVFIFKIFSLF